MLCRFRQAVGRSLTDMLQENPHVKRTRSRPFLSVPGPAAIFFYYGVHRLEADIFHRYSTPSNYEAGIMGTLTLL
jgi:hypothetical protein